MAEEEIMKKLKDSVINLDKDAAKEAAEEALKVGIDPLDAMKRGLYAGLKEVCDHYEETVFITDMLLASDAFYSGAEVLKAKIDKAKMQKKGIGVLGVIEGDVHDLGKNMLKYLLEAEGFEIHDLGFNVRVGKFIEEAHRLDADLILVSVMLSSKFPTIEKIVDLARENELKAKIMVGGGPVTEEIAKKYGADGWALTAPQAVKEALKLVEKSKY
ncbi:MAG: cobalamin-dependent protein [Candidatus Lokiarchaeota archaeon]|nr:cobalamin-dependent protein [Candidatus Lokiarchaeota archaeon]